LDGINKYLKLGISKFLLSMLAGLMIGVGGTVYLSTSNPIVGSLMFAIGLLIILIYKMNLFTGKIGYLPNNKFQDTPDLIIIWFGNLIGVNTYCCGLYYFRPELTIKATEMCNAKLLQPITATLFLGFMCGLLMYLAVDIFNVNRESKDIGKYIAVFLCVSVFILCKFEHCVADMFYFGMMNGLSLFSFTALKYIVIVTIGNSL